MAIGSAAYADPAGCVAATTSFTQLAGRILFAGGEGDCTSVKSLTLQVEIKRDVSLLPDALVTSDNEYANGKQWSLPLSSCDHGKSGTYYGRTFFTTNTTYHDSAHRAYTAC
jgi:hypothetical protein